MANNLLFFRHFKRIQLNFTSLNNLVFVCLSIRLLVDGVEEYLIQLTAWYYMEYLGESHVFLGITLAAFEIGSFLFSLCVGILTMRFHVSKTIVVMCGLTKFLGNLLYSIPVNGYFPLFGRFISGTGKAAVGVLYGAVAECTTKKNRMNAFLYFEGLYLLGAIFAPTIGSLLIFNVNILGWEINPGNSPGVVLAIVWFFIFILTMFLPSNLGENSKRKQIDSDTDSDQSNGDETSETEDNTNYILSSVCCIYYLVLLHMIVFNVVSFYTPLLAVHHLGLQLTHVKLIYLNSSLVVLILYIALYLFLGNIAEKKCLFVAIVSVIVPISITFYFAIMWNNAITVNGAYLLLISMVVVSIQFMNFTLACSLLSKITPTKSAAFYQSLGFATINLAIIIARPLAGATFDKIPMMYNCLGLAIAWAFGVIWIAVEYKNFPPKPSFDK